MNDPTTLLNLLDRILTRNLAWIATADAKIAPILAINTAMLGVIAALAPSSSAWTISSAIFSAIAGLLLLGSIICLVTASFPRLQGPKGSLIYFGGIAERDADTFVAELSKGITEEILRDFALQCHRNAQIAHSKYAYIKWAMILLYSSVPPFLIDVFLLYNIE